MSVHISPAKMREASDWLVRLRDESVSADDHALFDAWRDADPRHAQAFALVSRAIEEIGDIGGELRAHLETRPTPAPGRRGFAAAAMGMAALLVAGYFGYSALAPQSYATNVGEQRTVELADGSRVELNTDTRLSVRLTPDERLIELKQGEAVFEVAHDRDRPFIVTAHGQQVRAIGTQFVVRIDQERLSVLVVEGVVAVGQASGAHTAPHLIAGQRLELSSGPAPIVASVATIDIERDLAWRSGMLQFDGKPLIAAAREVERYTDLRFVIEDPDVAETRVWAYFPTNDIDGFLASLEQNVPDLLITQEGDRVHISSARAP